MSIFLSAYVRRVTADVNDARSPLQRSTTERFNKPLATSE